MALPMTVLALFMVTVLALGVMELARAEGELAVRSRQRIQALHLAEAGIERAKWKLRGHAGWEGDQTELGDGSVLVNVEPLAGRWVRVVATGRIGEQSKTVRVNMQIVPSQPGWPAAFSQYAVFLGGGGSTERLNLNNHVVVTGNVFTYGPLDVMKWATVEQGTVYATEGVSGAGTYTVRDEPSPLPGPVELNTAHYDAQIAAAAESAPGKMTIRGDPFDLNGQTLYVNGDVDIRTRINGPGRIVATGDIGLSVHSEGDGGIDLIAGGRLRLQTGVQLAGQDGNVLYSPTEIDLGNSAGVLGKSALLTPGRLVAGNGAEIEGLAWGGVVNTNNYAVIRGALYGDRFQNDAISNYCEIVHDPQALDFAPPPGVPTESGSQARINVGAWSED